MRPLRSCWMAASSFCGVSPAFFRISRGLAFGDDQAEQQALGGDVASRRPWSRPVRRRRARARTRWRRTCGRCRPALSAAPARRRRLRAAALARIGAGGAHQFGREAFAVVEQRLQEVLGFQLLVLFAERDGLGGLHESARALGELFHIHERPLRRPASTPIAAGSTWHVDLAHDLVWRRRHTRGKVRVSLHSDGWDDA